MTFPVLFSQVSISNSVRKGPSRPIWKIVIRGRKGVHGLLGISMSYLGVPVDDASAQLRPSLPIQARRLPSEATGQGFVSQHLSDVSDGSLRSGECVAVGGPGQNKWLCDIRENSNRSCNKPSCRILQELPSD